MLQVRHLDWRPWNAVRFHTVLISWTLIKATDKKWTEFAARLLITPWLWYLPSPDCIVSPTTDCTEIKYLMSRLKVKLVQCKVQLNNSHNQAELVCFFISDRKNLYHFIALIDFRMGNKIIHCFYWRDNKRTYQHFVNLNSMGLDKKLFKKMCFKRFSMFIKEFPLNIKLL